MIISVDFDGTVVMPPREYDDVRTPLQFVRGARAGLESLKKAEHRLILSSTRANTALRRDWRLNPLWQSGKVPIDLKAWARNQPLHEARYQQMVRFVAVKLPKVFDAIDDGLQGKVLADVYIDDRAAGSIGVDWRAVVKQFGEV